MKLPVTFVSFVFREPDDVKAVFGNVLLSFLCTRSANNIYYFE